MRRSKLVVLLTPLQQRTPNTSNAGVEVSNGAHVKVNGVTDRILNVLKEARNGADDFPQ